MVDGICHHHAPQQIFRKDLILFFHMDQFTRQTDHARLFQCLRFGKAAILADTGQRKKCHTSIAVLL